MKKGVKVWGLIAVLIVICSLFMGIVSTEVIVADVNKDIAATNVNVTHTSPKGNLELVRGDDETDTSTKNKTERIKVTPTSTHDMVVTNVNTTPSSPDLEQPTVIYVTVTNEGEQQEDNVSVKVYVDSAQIGSTQYISLAPGSSNTTTFLWTPTTAKAYSVKGEVEIVNGEIDVKDNTKSIKVMVSAVPTPMPGTPSNPSPSNHTTDVYINTNLDWSDCSNTDFYDVYFGTYTHPPYYGNAPTSNYPFQNNLEYGTKYYWKIEAKNNCGGNTSGLIWDFNTEEAPNQQPTAIINSITPDPAGQGTDTVSFSGHGTDPDGTMAAYNWSSSIDGPLSTSAAFTKPASELSVGTHAIYFKVQDDDGMWSTEDTEDLTIYSGPELSYSPELHDFCDMRECETDNTTFEIWNSGTDTLTYSLSETCDWLEVNPTSGSSTGEHNTITVDMDTTGLFEGTHTGDITINSNDGSGTFTVMVNVMPCPCGNMSVNPTSWSTTLNCSESDSQIVTVSATGGTVKGVTVSKVSGPTWLSVSPMDLGDIASGSNKTFTMTAAPPSEASGDFGYTVTVSNTCGTPSTRDVSGTIHVSCPCGNKGVYPTSWSPTLNCGESDSQIVTVSASDCIVNGVTVSKVSGPTWLSVSQTDLGDIASGSSETFTVTADPPAGTSSGDYPYTIRVSNTCGTPSTRDVAGTINVKENADGQTEYWAVIVGVADYTGTLYDLAYTDDDAIDMYNTLLLSGDYWQHDHIKLLLDSEADKAGILAAFNWLDDNEDPDDVVLFFFSGHGTYGPDDDGDELDGWDEYICPYDFNNIRDDELDAELDRLESTSIAVLIDSCFAGGMTKAPDRSVKTLLKQKVELTDGFAKDIQSTGKDIGDAGRVVLMACDDGEYSYEIYELENGLFSYYVIEGLEGSADAEGNGDDICSAEETFVYVEPRVVDYISTQHPQLYDEYPGELPITRPFGISECDGTATSCGIYPNCENCNEDDSCYPYSNGCEERDYYCVSNEAGCGYTYSNRHTDDWVDTGNTDWVDVNECQEKERKEQKYWDYYCSGGACTYSVTDTKWVDTGNTRNKPDGTICGCTASNTLKRCYGGVCTDTGICNSSICGADAACDGKVPGDSCGGGGICDSNCKCGGQAVGEDYGVFNAPLWFVDKNCDQLADDVFGYGFAGATPLVGDFNQDGSDDIAVVDLPWWFVDTNGDQIADETFSYGFAGGTPLVGDFNQDGKDDIAVVSLPTWFVDTDMNQVADDVFGYGFAGATPMVGDFNQDGSDDIAVVDLPWWFVDTNGDQIADETFSYGFAGGTPLVGDFNQDGSDDIAVVSLPTWFVDTDRDQVADDTFGYGFAGATPIVGNFG